MPPLLMGTPARPQMPAAPLADWKKLMACSSVPRSIASTPDLAPLQPCEILVYKTSSARFRLQFFENGGTNCLGGMRSSPSTTFRTCSLPSLATAKTLAVSPSLRIRGVAFSALGHNQSGSCRDLPSTEKVFFQISLPVSAF